MIYIIIKLKKKTKMPNNLKNKIILIKFSEILVENIKKRLKNII